MSGRGALDGLGGLRLCGGWTSLAARERLRSARRARRKLIMEAWSALGEVGEGEEAADRKRARIWYPALRAE